MDCGRHTRWTRWGCAVLPFFFAGIAGVENANLDFHQPETVADRRVNLCKQMDDVLRNGSKMQHALRGVHVTALTRQAHADAHQHDKAWFFEAPDGTQTGLHVDLMREVAASAGFTYTIVAVPPEGGPDQSLSWNDYLNQSAAKFDINLDWCHLSRCFLGNILVMAAY